MYAKNVCYDQEKQEKQENEATARASALAINKNWNILFPPDSAPWDAKQSPAQTNAKKTPEDYLSNLMNRDDEENVAVAEAEGKAIIRNKNINVVVYI